jgi:hypothetical protein
MLKGLQPTKLKDKEGRFYMDYWETSKRMLNEMNFLESLETYDKVRRCGCLPLCYCALSRIALGALLGCMARA